MTTPNALTALTLDVLVSSMSTDILAFYCLPGIIYAKKIRRTFSHAAAVEIAPGVLRTTP